jgi:MFS transporter, PAT family, beta-lactamase induction signal transducer AmpG
MRPTPRPLGTTQKLVLLGALYLSQGLPYGFFTQALPVVMRRRGYSLESIGLSSLLLLPWALKFLWAPAVDRFGWPRLGRRRSWILPLQALSVALLVTLSCAGGHEVLSLLVAGVFLTNLLSATQDIATDGLAVDLLSSSERGLANGLQVAAYRVGMILGGGVLLILHDRLGWATTFLTMAALIGAATVPVLLLREQPPVVAVDAPRASLLNFLRRPGMGRVLALVVIYKAGDHFGTGMLRPYLVDAGLSLADVGWLLGTVGFVAGLLGALAGGALVNPLGRLRALVVFGLLQAASVGGYALLALGAPSRELLVLACGAEHLLGGMATAALFTAMMDWCRPGSNATDYTVQASAINIAGGLASTLSGYSAGALRYAGHFGLAALLAVGAVAVLPALFPRPADPPR